MAKEVFEGIKILDFSWIAVGPLSVRSLADHGATVVRVESARRPEAIRTSPPFKDNVVGIDRSGYFIQYHANKYSLALNLDHPRSLEVIRKLVAWADIVAESFTPGAMERRGLGYEDLKKIKPDIIMYRTCNQGQTGPHARHAGFGAQLVGLSGMSYITGWEDRDPVQPFGAYTDWLSPCFGAPMLIAALDYRRRTGKGQCLDLSQLEASIHALTPLILSYQANGRECQPMGNASPCAAPHAAYQCAGDDRWCTIAVFTDDEWRALCKVIGRTDLVQDPRFATLLARKKNEAELNALVTGWTRHHTAEEVMSLMQSAGVAAGVAQNGRDLVEDPQLKHTQGFWWLEHREIGPYPHYGVPFRLSETPAVGRLPCACLGEHTEYVCKEILKMSDEEFVELLVDGVLE